MYNLVAVLCVATELPQYLESRKHFVSVSHCDSGILTVSCGVPQGSILGQQLLIIDTIKVTCLDDKKWIGSTPGMVFGYLVMLKN